MTLAFTRPQIYYRLVQEDGFVEWATFWAFLVGACVFVAAALRNDLPVRWSLLLAALFCSFVALEEISWGQRIVSFRPPAFFLERNFQQELNLHNVASESVRQAVLVSLLGGWGVALPLAAWAWPGLRLTEWRALLIPPIGLAAAFVAALSLQLIYPVEFSGEIVELMLGVLLLAVALTWTNGSLHVRWWPAVAVIVLASAATVRWSATRRADDRLVADAERELGALAADLVTIAQKRGEAPTGCGIHKRLYTFVSKYHVTELRELSYARLAGAAAARERIEYFLDPWNSPYWVRDECSEHGARRSAFVYSFGPNQLRESTDWKVAGDDIGVYLARTRGRKPHAR